MNVVCLFFLIFAPSPNVTTNMDLFDNRYETFLSCVHGVRKQDDLKTT